MPRHPPRTLILCFDGTAYEYSSANSNVVKFLSLLSKDVNQQLVYYQAGIGTYFAPGFISPVFSWCAKVLDEAIAFYLPEHVMQGYKFLMQNYRDGDRVCLFGWSRGAYTARALAGMVHKVGLLSRDNDEQIPFAYEIYKSDKPKDVELAAGFKKTFGREVPIEFVGVWDTVASVGLLSMRSLPFVQTNTMIRTFRQALALDEHRAKFRPSFYNRPIPSTRASGYMSRRKDKLVDRETVSGSEDLSTEASGDAKFVTDVKEVWFPGCHGDIGGGKTPNDAANSLSNIPLLWMVREVIKAQCGVAFGDDAFARLGLPRDPLNMFDAKDENEAREQRDAVQPLHDELKSMPIWWLVEVVPTQFSYQSVVSNQWVNKWSVHLGRGRFVPPEANFHESVRYRMSDVALKYKPKATYEESKVTFVT